jgi:hypothetical protein
MQCDICCASVEYGRRLANIMETALRDKDLSYLDLSSRCLEQVLNKYLHLFFRNFCLLPII